MVPNNYPQFINGLTDLVKGGYINMHRIDDAVTRILRVKFAMGLFEKPLADRSYSKHLGSEVSVNIELPQQLHFMANARG